MPHYVYESAAESYLDQINSCSIGFVMVYLLRTMYMHDLIQQDANSNLCATLTQPELINVRAHTHTHSLCARQAHFGTV